MLNVYAVNIGTIMLTASTCGRVESVNERSQQQRSAYHHGDLHKALSAAGAELAREGGPEAVVLREAARRVGVSPTAAYRHFANHADLLGEVKEQAQTALADAMRAALDRADESTPAVDAGLRARGRLLAIGRGYVNFALDQPGLFRTAFHRLEHTGAARPEQDRDLGPGLDDLGFAARSYRLLGDILDELLAAGLIAPDRRPGAEAAAWAGVHGLASLLLDGPLRRLPRSARDQVVELTLAVIADGLRPAAPI